MTRWKRRVLQVVGLLAAVSVGAALVLAHQWVAIGTAYEAKLLCSGVFVSGRTPESLLAADLSLDEFAIFRRASTDVDRQTRTVTVDLFGLAPQRAVYHDGLGCRVVRDEVEAATAATVASPSGSPAALASDVWVVDAVASASAPASASASAPAVDQARLQAALDAAFAEPDASRPQHTRAIAVVYQGHLVGERYATGFSKDTPLLGWSLTKSVTNALVGIAVGEGKLAIDKPPPVPEWQTPDDPRRRITLDQLLRMSSGLRFNEDYSSPLVDVARMLFGSSDMAAYAAAKPQQAAPEMRWSYSSGDTLIVSRALRQAIGAADYAAFPRRALFDRLGMRSALIETDASGTFVGSSFMYATARDWARFGLLYLGDGVVGGQRILPPGWVAYSRTPTLAAPAQQYGAHFWLKLPTDYLREAGLPPLPADTFHAVGHEGQLLTIIPSHQLVVVRLGQTRVAGGWDHHAFVDRVLGAVGR